MSKVSDELHPRRKLQLHSKQFSVKYPRLERDSGPLAEKNVPAQLKSRLVGSIEASIEDVTAVYATTLEVPRPSLVHLIDRNLAEIIPHPHFNRLLIYRMLNLMYGRPDILGGWVFAPEDGKGEPRLLAGEMDWGYTIQIDTNIVGEIRSTEGMAQFASRFWCGEDFFQTGSEETINKAIRQFVIDLVNAVESNLHLFSESIDTKNKNTTTNYGTTNLFAMHYLSGERLIKLTEKLQVLSDQQDLSSSDTVEDAVNEMNVAPYLRDAVNEMNMAPYLDTSAAINFAISLEAFINAIYHTLLRDDFQYEAYDRMTTKSDLDMRLLNMHIFCDGFQSCVVSPGDEIWKRFIQLRDFRNIKVHGSVMDEHQDYLIMEDNMFFGYSPSLHFRGRKEERKRGKNIASSVFIQHHTVTEIKNIVDDIVEAILAAMDQDTCTWVKTWLHQTVIHRVPR